MINQIRIAIADRFSLPAKSLCLLLSSFNDFQIIGDFRSCSDLTSVLETQTNLSLLIVDFIEGDQSTFTCLKSISFKYPKLKILILYNDYNKNLSKDFKDIGVSKYVSKSIDPDLLAKEILTLFDIKQTNSQFKIHPNISNQKSDFKVSKRETQIISLIAKGETGPQIANKLFISLNTIKQHKKNIFQKLNIRNVQEMVAFAIKNNM